MVGGACIGRVTVTPEGGTPGAALEPLQIDQLLKADNTTEHFASLVRRYARAKQMVHAWNEGMASVRDPKNR